MSRGWKFEETVLLIGQVGCGLTNSSGSESRVGVETGVTRSGGDTVPLIVLSEFNVGVGQLSCEATILSLYLK
jgi:hypothetical protein